MSLQPFCQRCGWRKGGTDSWNGKACKCGLAEKPMNEIPITDATKRLLENKSNAFLTGARRSGMNDDLDWMVTVGSETLERLEGAMLPGESYDETIERLCRGLQ